MIEDKFINKATLHGVTYYIKDSNARERLTSLEDVIEEGPFFVVETLPTASEDTLGKLYFIAQENSEQDIYDEYITIVNKSSYSWGKIGSATADIDLSSYWNETNLKECTEDEITAIFD